MLSVPLNAETGGMINPYSFEISNEIDERSQDEITSSLSFSVEEGSMINHDSHECSNETDSVEKKRQCDNNKPASSSSTRHRIKTAKKYSRV